MIPMSASRLTFISHAATEAQRHAAFPADDPVLEREIAKIAQLRWSAPETDQIFSAPEQRTRQTSHALRLTATPADELRDCHYGRWRGRKMDAIQTEDPRGIFAWLTDPRAAPHGGESLESLIGRVGRWMDEQQAVKHAIAVTHPAIIRAAIIHALQIPVHLFWRIDIAPLTLTDLRFNRDVWTVRCTGCPLRTARQEDEAGN